MSAQPFTIQVDDDVLSDLQQRLQGTRWPDEIADADAAAAAASADSEVAAEGGVEDAAGTDGASVNEEEDAAAKS